MYILLPLLLLLLLLLPSSSSFFPPRPPLTSSSSSASSSSSSSYYIRALDSFRFSLLNGPRSYQALMQTKYILKKRKNTSTGHEQVTQIPHETGVPSDILPDPNIKQARARDSSVTSVYVTPGSSEYGEKNKVRHVIQVTWRIILTRNIQRELEESTTFVKISTRNLPENKYKTGCLNRTSILYTNPYARILREE